MARADYEHWNEEADRVWWEEEGRQEPSDLGDLSDEDIKQAIYEGWYED